MSHKPRLHLSNRETKLVTYPILAILLLPLSSYPKEHYEHWAIAFLYTATLFLYLASVILILFTLVTSLTKRSLRGIAVAMLGAAVMLIGPVVSPWIDQLIDETRLAITESYYLGSAPLEQSNGIAVFDWGGGSLVSISTFFYLVYIDESRLISLNAIEELQADRAPFLSLPLMQSPYCSRRLKKIARQFYVIEITC